VIESLWCCGLLDDLARSLFNSENCRCVDALPIIAMNMFHHMKMFHHFPWRAVRLPQDRCFVSPFSRQIGGGVNGKCSQPMGIDQGYVKATAPPLSQIEHHH
jgi:hypothetical protein